MVLDGRIGLRLVDVDVNHAPADAEKERHELQKGGREEEEA